MATTGEQEQYNTFPCQLARSPAPTPDPDGRTRPSAVQQDPSINSVAVRWRFKAFGNPRRHEDYRPHQTENNRIVKTAMDRARPGVVGGGGWGGQPSRTQAVSSTRAERSRRAGTD